MGFEGSYEHRCVSVIPNLQTITGCHRELVIRRLGLFAISKTITGDQELFNELNVCPKEVEFPSLQLLLY